MTYGSGISLDEDWDLEISQTGDIKATHDSDEFRKDLAYMTARRLEIELGQPLSSRSRAIIESIVRDILERDPRVRSIKQVTVEDIEGGDGVTIGTRIVAYEESNVPEDFFYEVTQ